MKKIGIITLFGYQNYGNRLQMFAVQKVYEKLGFTSEILKYKLPETKDSLWIRAKVFLHYLFFLRSNLAVYFLKRKRISNFKKHASHYYKETKYYFDPLKIEKNFHVNYSFFSVGSDQIWGSFANSMSDFIFLKFAPKIKRIAFSPSFGSSDIKEKFRKNFTDGLLGFENLSVREESGAEIVKNFTGKNVEILCDPTMCLSKNEWLDFSAIPENKPAGKYIITYFLGEMPQGATNVLNKISNDFEIVELNNLKVSKYYDIDPSEWVDLINGSALFLTDSFHGVVFSIILKTPFVVYTRIGGENMQTRITNILEKFNLQNRFKMDFKDKSLFRVDFSQTEKIIEQEREKVNKFLQNSLNI
ncbi:polysaccharide pyruvyl transferase family protein [Halpernia frigidisoli]|uniref:Polysaccharide pyruvyl transferase n=1 Tax=Halpernia frigidisoli TaxID=1125876 RepID=A0A1I3FEI7_9FLAO|nr:polysaccharide pyruvyl transferase family protein [Halpernia frigidisoli]SFI09587.1 Polysaccharide pyruvyl transferase [Halpernia frigidisoli]